MIQGAKDTWCGYKALSTDLTNPAATHVLMNMEDYERLIEKIEAIKRECEQTLVDYQRQATKAWLKREEKQKKKCCLCKDSYHKTIRAKEKDWQAKCVELEARCEESEDIAQKTYKTLAEMSAYLEHAKRVEKERSCQERGIPRKKMHSGYLVISSYQFSDRVPDADDPNIIVPIRAWKTTLQTPYRVEHSLSEIDDLIYEDLRCKVLDILGVNTINGFTNNGHFVREIMTKIVCDGGIEEKDPCVVYRWAYHVHYASRFWEVDIYHTTPISVPVEMLPPSKGGDKKQPGNATDKPPAKN